MGLENLPLVGSYAKLFSLKELDLGPGEASVVTKIRWCQVLRGLLTNINKPAMLAQFLVLCKGDAALMAAEMGRTQAAVNLSWLLLAPGVSSLSDAIGRPLLSGLRPIGLGLFNLVLLGLEPLSATLSLSPLTLRFLAESLLVGVLGAGGRDVQSAAMSDLFGSRPMLSSKLQTCEGMCWDASGMIGPFIGAFIASRSVKAGFATAAIIGFMMTFTSMTVPETLRRENRKPFSVKQANALANVHLLFSSGVGLRRMAIAATLCQSMQSIHNTIPTFLMGALGCSTSEVSMIGVASAVGMLGCQGFVVAPTLGRFGLFKTYKIGLLGGAVSLLLQGNAQRGVGGRHSLMMVNFLIAQAVEDLVYELCWHTGRSMLVKQGMSECPEAGMGRLNASFIGLGSIIGTVMPVVWGRLFGVFIKAAQQQQAHPLMRLMGSGGHLLVGSAMMAVAYVVLHFMPSKHLRLEEEDAKPKEEEEEEEEEAKETPSEEPEPEPEIEIEPEPEPEPEPAQD